jgi:hypothetical protein
MIENIVTIPKWVWWTKGECVVEVLKRGHYPTTIMAKLPSDLVTEIELVELELAKCDTL